MFATILLSPLSTLNLINQSFPNHTGNSGLLLGSRFINPTGRQITTQGWPAGISHLSRTELSFPPNSFSLFV